ncbi:MAG: hypothetical protein FWH33_10515 [Oscillospiraceae bacterium]|nr:hypothetical protein [Oscillospiraceae bacterium]
MLLFITLVLLVALTTACSGSGADTIGTQEGGSKRDGGDAKEAVFNLPFPVEAGYFDRDFDYMQHERFKVAYLVTTGVANVCINFGKALAIWAKQMNIDYKGMYVSTENSKMSFMSLAQTQIDLGIDGIIFDGSDDKVEPIFEMCAEAGVATWRCTNISRDTMNSYMYGDTYVAGALIYPFIGGEIMNKSNLGIDILLRWKEKEYPDVPWEKVGMICIGSSSYEEEFMVVLSVKKKWCDASPSFGSYSDDPKNNPMNFWFADMSTQSIMGDSLAFTERLISEIVEPNNNIEVWLIPAASDICAMGAADALKKQRLSENACIYSIFSNYDLSKIWDTDDYSAWRYAACDLDIIMAEPTICALWALMAGQCTPETLWPQWVKPWDKGDVFEFEGDKPRVNVVNTLKLGSDGKPIVIEEHSYAQALFPTNWIDRERYREFFAWLDFYAFDDDTESYIYNEYPRVYDIDLFNARATVPDDYYRSPLEFIEVM